MNDFTINPAQANKCDWVNELIYEWIILWVNECTIWTNEQVSLYTKSIWKCEWTNV